MFFAEATTTDVIIGLHYNLIGVQAHRALEVVKARGAPLLSGLHGFRVDSDGAYIYPRLEARIARLAAGGKPETNETGSSADGARRQQGGGAQWHVSEGRAAFALPELDALLGGGVPRETSTLLVGSLGSGKTLLALHFALAGVREGEAVHFLGFRENQWQLARPASGFTIGKELQRALVPGGGLTWQRWAPVELNPDIIADRLLDTLDRTHACRLVIDGIAELQRAIAHSGNASRIGDFVAALVEALHERHVTSLFIAEHPKVIASAVDFSSDPISIVAENILLLQQLRYREDMRRVVTVLKMRLSAHDLALREFTISAPEGIRVLQPRESPVDALASLAEGQPVRRKRPPHANGPDETTGRPSSSRPAEEANP